MLLQKTVSKFSQMKTKRSSLCFSLINISTYFTESYLYQLINQNFIHYILIATILLLLPSYYCYPEAEKLFLKPRTLP